MPNLHMEETMHRNRLMSVLAIAVLAGACASSGQPGSSPRRNRNLITADELAELNVTSAFEAVRQLRPAWLTRRGGSAPIIYLNSTRWSGTPEGLESIQLQSISEMRFLSASDATTRFGTGFQGGVIMVTTR